MGRGGGQCRHIGAFPNAIGLGEASYTTWDHGVPRGPIVYGTEGTLAMEPRGASQVVRLEHSRDQTRIYEPEPMPSGRQGIAWEFIHHLETGEPTRPTIEMIFNLAVISILDAGVRSAVSGQTETVDSAPWCIG